MAQIGIRELKQNASAAVARAAAGEDITVTDRGRPVARLVPLRASRLEDLIASGQARTPRRPFVDVPPARRGPSLSNVLEAMRDDERY